MVDFSSNDYLGLSVHPEMRRRAADYAERFGVGNGASRLVTGDHPAFSEIETKLARGKKAEAALILSSGFQTNATVLGALMDKTTLEAEPILFADRLNHASLIQGALASGARQVRFRHNDLDHLESLLAKHQGEGRFLFIATETVFSMDGDRADLPRLEKLAEKYSAFLYLDDAHATGVLGPDGFGLGSGLIGPNCMVMGTFSKALGGFGSYVACTGTLRDYLINRCPGLIYSTALPPAVLGAMDAALDLVSAMESERALIQSCAESFRRALRGAGLDIGASSSQIVPVILGDSRKALAISRNLEREGFLGMAIRPPTVPPGKARIRFAFSARHRQEDALALAEAIIRLTEEIT
ncbi:putative 8-amino-7-oxononanoate synthase [Alphaproteobacteria bacterium]|nr:putative 8-amino-7-oxononanoate synthase [Alphaproteobacteria bacterium]